MTYTVEARLREFVELNDHLKTLLDKPDDAERMAVENLKVNYLERLEGKFLKQELGY